MSRPLLPIAKFNMVILLVAYIILFGGGTGEVYASISSNSTFEFAGGTGEESDPWQITKIEHLYNMRNHLGQHYILMNNLDFSLESDYIDPNNKFNWTANEGWEPIGNESTPFSGVLDGNGKTIKGLTINRLKQYQGLFGYTSSSAKIFRGRLEMVSIKGQQYAGALAGVNYGVIENFSAEGEVTGTSTVGGLVGINRGLINCSYAQVKVSGARVSGGLVGNNDLESGKRGAVSNSYATGDVDGVGLYVGGLIGIVSGGTVNNCYSTGKTNGKGLIGASTVGSSIENCYYDSTASGCSDSGNGEPKTTAEMKSLETFINWVFGENAVWNIINTKTHYSYPYLIDNPQDPYPGYSLRAPKNITSFVFKQLNPPVSGLIDNEQHTIRVQVPSETAIENLIPDIAYEGISISPSPGVPQNFSEPVKYTVFAADESRQDYLVIVSIQERKPVINSVTGVDAITVAYGTSLAKALEALPPATTIIDSNGNIHSVSLIWFIQDYDGCTPGAYLAKGTFILPDGVHQADPPLDLQVITTVWVEPHSIPPNQSPFWPENSSVKAVSVTFRDLTISWSPAQDDHEVTGYRIYKNGLLVDEVSGTVNSYVITGLSPATRYTIRIEAGDKDGSWTTDGPVLVIRTKSQNSSSMNSEGADYKLSSRAQYWARLYCGEESCEIEVLYDQLGDELSVILEKQLINELATKHRNNTSEVKIYIEMPASIIASSYSLILKGKSDTQILVKDIILITPLAKLTITNDMLAEIMLDGVEEVSLHIRREGDDRILGLNNSSSISLAVGINDFPAGWVNTAAPILISLSFPNLFVDFNDTGCFSVYYLDNDNQSILIPDEHYHYEDKTIILRCEKSGTYSVVFEPQVFKDLADFSWVEKPVRVLTFLGITVGTSPDTFSPELNITRADYLVMLCNLLGITADFENNFADVNPGDYYYKTLGAAKQLGIAFGANNNRFYPHNYISRQDMVVFAVRALGALGKISTAKVEPNILDTFIDTELADQYAWKSLEIMVSEGVLYGYNNRLHPKSETTRAEAAVFLYQIYKKYCCLYN